MGVDHAKCVAGFLWKMTRVSMKFCYMGVRKYPYAACVLSVLFLLFMFLPSVFFFLIYSSPIVALATLSIQIYFKTKRAETQNAKKNEEKPSPSVESKPVAVIRRGEKPVISKQLSRRRNPKQNIELDTTLNDASSSINGNQDEKSDIFIADKGIGFSDGGEIAGLVTSSAAQNVQAACDDLKGKSSLNEGKSKGIYTLDQGESSSRKIQELDQPSSDHLTHYGSVDQSGNISADGGGGAGGEMEVESSDGEYDEEEEAQQDGNRAVEWNENDQKNLMDLGDSELERNKRLESLIAKRRARKLFKMAIEKKLVDSGNAAAAAAAAAVPIPPIFTLNKLLNGIPNSLDESLPIPGSAPSVLLPARNPFDLPYDPLEEKPDLMADSFQQEFMEAQQKEVLFCRHESFCWEPSSLSSEYKQDQHDSRFGPFGTEKKNEDGHRFSKFRSQSYVSCHDQLIDELLLQGDEDLSHNVSATDLVDLEREASKTNSSESKQEEDKTTDKGKTRIEGESEENLHDMETDSAKDNSTDRCSLASDEVSELSFSSSVPSSNIDILEAKMGKFPEGLGDRVQSAPTFSVQNSMAFDGSSYESSSSVTDKPRLADRFFYREKGSCHSPGYSIASDLQVEVSEVGSPPFTVDGTASPADAESLNDGDIDKDIALGSEEMLAASCHLESVEENESRSREINEVSEDDIVEVGFSAVKQNLEDSPTASSKLPEGVTEKYLLPENGQEHSENLDEKVPENVIQVAEEGQKSSQSLDPWMDSGAHPPHEVHSHRNPEEASDSPEKSAEEVKVTDDAGDGLVHANNDKAKLESIGEKSTSESNNSDEPAWNQTITELEKKIEDMMNSEPIEGEPGKINEHEDIGGTSRTIEGIEEDSPIPITSAPHSELVAEQIPTDDSSSPSSPRSVIPGDIMTDQTPSSSYDQLVHHIDVPQSIVDDIFRTNSLDEDSSEGFTRSAPQNLQQLLVDPSDQKTSTSTDSHKSEEKSTREANVENITNPVVSEKEDEEKLKSAEGNEGESHISMTGATEEQKLTEANTSESIEDDKENKGELTENEAIAVHSANSESSLEAVKDSQGESEKSENEPAMKPSTSASGTAEGQFNKAEFDQP